MTSAKSDEHIDMLVNWYQTGFVHDITGNKLENIEVSKKHKHSIMQRIWSSQSITLDAKKEFLASLEKIDNSDWMVNTKMLCHSAHPENKGEMWKKYFSTDKDGECEEWGLYHHQNSFRGWNQVSHRAHTDKYSHEFFDLISGIVARKGRYVAEAYFYILRPMNNCDEAAIKQYQDLLDKVLKEDPDNTMFIKMLKSTITDLNTMQRGRACSQKYLDSQK